MSTIHQNDLISSLSKIFGSSKYSDLTICCGSDVYKVHRAVICPRSDFFAAACDSGFKESTTATITLNDDDQSTVQRMLTYLYTLDYDDGDAFPVVPRKESPNTDRPVPDLNPKPDDETISHCKSMNNIRVYALADKYNIPTLKELAKIKFMTCMTVRGVKITRFPKIVDSIFNSTHETDRGLRDIIISMAANISTLEMLGEGPLASAIRDHSTFGLGLLQEVVKKHEKQKQDARMKRTELRRAALSLYLDSQRIYLPVEEDSKEDFDRCYQAAYAFRDKFRKFQDTLKSED